MRVCLVAADEGGCGYYRMRWPGETLVAQGHDVHVSDRGDADTRIATDFDVIVIQRPLRSSMLAHIQQLQAAGVAVVVEIDDDFSAMQSNNIAYRDLHPKLSPDANWNILARAAAIADLVTVSTPALAQRYGQHGRVAVLPNYIPERYLDVPLPVESGPLRLGWTGSLKTHPGDLGVMGGAVHQAMAVTNSMFVAIGDQGVLRELDAPGIALPWADLLTEYPSVVASLDVGVVPLIDNAFNRAKSWLKGLEFAALGVPFVASPLPEYRALNKFGAGMIATRPRQWRTYLRDLLSDDALRMEQAMCGREAASQLTIEEHAWRWMEAYEHAVANRRKLVAA